MADHSRRAVKGDDLRPLACWDYGFESRWGHGCLSLVSVVYRQVEVPATGRSPSRGVLPTVECHCVSSTNLEHEEALARVGLLRQKQKN